MMTQMLVVVIIVCIVAATNGLLIVLIGSKNNCLITKIQQRSQQKIILEAQQQLKLFQRPSNRPRIIQNAALRLSTNRMTSMKTTTYQIMQFCRFWGKSLQSNFNSETRPK